MNLYKRYRPFLKAISEYGLYPEITKKHMKIMKEGRVVSSMSLTPNINDHAIDHTLRHLMNGGHLPKVNRNSYAHELKRKNKEMK